MQCYHSLGFKDSANFGLAIQEGEGILAGDIKDVGILLEMAQIYTEMEEYERSLEISERLIAEFQVYAAYASSLENSRRQLDAGGVVRNASQCIRYFPTFVKSYEYLAKVYLDLNRREDFDKVLEDAEKNGVESVILDAYRFQMREQVMARRNNWNRWAVHGTDSENGYESVYSHYNQTLGMGYYEYFLLCELIGAKPLPVLNVGFACQYQSDEMVSRDSAAFREFLQDALDLIEFANGAADTPWGAVRAEMGHPNPFGLTMVGIGNEQWQTEKADFFERYEMFEKTIHEHAPYIRLIGSAGPNVSSGEYRMAWEFYHAHEDRPDFAYAVDEHYYVPPKWLYEHVDFYDEYPRKVKVFSGEYAAHPSSGFNNPKANTLDGALAEAAFLTGVERNVDVVVLASYAPLFARVGYAQWSPDLIWFDGAGCYGSPSYYVQKMYACNMGDVELDTCGGEREAWKEGIYYCAGLARERDEIIVKIVNSKEEARSVDLALPERWKDSCKIQAQILTGESRDSYNSHGEPEKIMPMEKAFMSLKGIELPPLSFTVLRIGARD